MPNAPLRPEDNPSQDPEDVDRPASAAPTKGELERQRLTLDYGQDALPPRHDPYLALRYPSYVVLTVGWLVAVIGSAIQSTAIGWEIFFAQLAAAVCSTWLAFLSYSPTWGVGWMYAAIILNSTALVLGRPARAALMPMVVPPHVFANAVTWNSSMFQIATVAGPALGGLIIGLSLNRWGSLSLAYGLAAGCIGSFGFIALLLRTRPMEQQAGPVDRSLSAGLRFVWNTKIILATMSLDLFAVLLGGATYLLPVFAKEILNVSPLHFGWLRSAEAIGALGMTVLLAHLPPMKHAGRAILLSVAGFGLATIVFGLSRDFYLSFAMLVAIGACDSISVVIRHTLVQVHTPDHMRGRVAAVNNVFIGASNELGGLESGVMAKLIGPVGSVVFGGCGTLVVVGLISVFFPQIRRLKGLQKE
jgi:MFS family permease